MEGVGVGRLVHYTDPKFAGGECRAALIVRVWNEQGTCNLTVFPDWGNDHRAGPSDNGGSFWATSVQNREVLLAANPEIVGPTWHWPERV